MMICLLHLGMIVLHTVLWKIGLLNLNVVDRRSSVVNEHRSGRLKDAASAENIQIINDILNKDRRLTIWHIVETTSINCSTVHRIVSEELGVRKVSTRWVPRLLTKEQKKVRVDVCTDLSRLQAEPQTFLDHDVRRRSITLIQRQNGKVWYGSMSQIQGYPHQQARSFGTVKEL